MQQVIFRRLGARFFILYFFLCILASIGVVTPKTLPADIKKADLLSPLSENGEAVRASTFHKDIIGFLPYWNVDKNQSITTRFLTQLIYFGIPVSSDGTLVAANKSEWQIFTGNHFASLKTQAQNQNIKILVALTNFNGEDIQLLLENKEATYRLTQFVTQLLVTYNLGGVTIDFEYEGINKGPIFSALPPFITLLKTSLRERNPDAIVSVALSPRKLVADHTIPLQEVGTAADQVIIMGYDFHNTTSQQAGPVSPLFGEVNELSIDNAITIAKAAIPAEKIILGVPFYGYEWETYTTNYKSTAVPKTAAVASYKRVQKLIAEKDVVSFWDEISKTPWITYQENGKIKQIYYEDTKSLAVKTEYIALRQLGGIAVWALGYEGEYTQPWEVIAKFKK